MSCIWYPVCSMKAYYEQGRLNREWIDRYCLSTGNWKQCRRYQLEEQGIAHPDTMLPNGEIARDLEAED